MKCITEEYAAIVVDYLAYETKGMTLEEALAHAKKRCKGAADTEEILEMLAKKLRRVE